MLAKQLIPINDPIIFNRSTYYCNINSPNIFLSYQAFELAKSKLDVTELRNTLGQASKAAADKDLAANELQQQLQQLAAEKEQLAEQLHNVSAR